MSRKDYEAIAACLRQARKEADEITAVDVAIGVHRALDSLAYDLSHVFHMDNDRFDSHRWMVASGQRDVGLFHP